jgi:diguanylate cyclase (GGDEF)-like protein
MDVRSLAADRVRALAAIAAPPSTGPLDPALAATELADVFQATVAILRRSGGRWSIVGASEAGRSMPSSDELQGLLSGRRKEIRTVSSPAGYRWTVVRLYPGGVPRAAIIVAGDWRLSSGALTALAIRLSAALRLPGGPSRDEGRASLRLASRLASVRGLTSICEVIVEAMTKGVSARLGCIAVMDPSESRLVIKATCGYPIALVEHLRIEPGAGILGSVYQTRKALHVTEAAGLPSGLLSRPRYRTASCIALPLEAGGEVTAVVAVADRADNQPFTEADLSRLRALAAPAALGLARERAMEQAETYAQAAAIDPLSGLFNRRYFHIRLEEELQRAARHQIPLALLMMDVDDFKNINDTYGHLTGDFVVREAAEIVRRSVRVFDICTRFGGDEFAIIMPGSGVDSATGVAERIRERLETYRSLEAPLENLALTVSIGLAVSVPATTPRALIEQADRALYLAKRSGKNCVKLAE